MQHHDLKTDPKWFQMAWDERKLFSVRNNDRGFQVDDTIRKLEFDRESQTYTGRYADFVVTSVVRAEDYPDGIREGFCVLGIRMFAWGKGDESEGSSEEIINEGAVLPSSTTLLMKKDAE